MSIPAGTLVDDKFTLLHSGNHNEIGNPHNQYNLPVYSTVSNGTLDSTQLVKILSFTTTKERFKFMADLSVWSICTSDKGTKGILSIDIEGTGGGYYTSILRFNNKNINQGVFNNHFYLYVTSLGNNLYTFDLYFEFKTSYETLKFCPVVTEYQPEKTWTAYKYSNIIRRSDIFLDSQPIVTKSSITATLVRGSISDISVLNLSTLPTASVEYEGKIVYIPQGGSTPAQGFMCICTSSNVYTWDKITKSIQTVTINAGQTTIDYPYVDVFNLGNTTATTITTINNGYEGKTITFLSFNSNTTIQNNSSIALKGGVNVTPPAKGVLVLRYMSGIWYEISRNF